MKSLVVVLTMVGGVAVMFGVAWLIATALVWLGENHPMSEKVHRRIDKIMQWVSGFAALVVGVLILVGIYLSIYNGIWGGK